MVIHHKVIVTVPARDPSAPAKYASNPEYRRDSALRDVRQQVNFYGLGNHIAIETQADANDQFSVINQSGVLSDLVVRDLLLRSIRVHHESEFAEPIESPPQRDAKPDISGLLGRIRAYEALGTSDKITEVLKEVELYRTVARTLGASSPVSLRDQLNLQTDQAIESLDRVNELRRQLDASAGEVQRAREAALSLEGRIGELEGEVQGSKDEIRKLIGTIHSLENPVKIVTPTRGILPAAQEILDSLAQGDSLRKEYAKLEADLSRMQDLYSEGKEEASGLKKQVRDLRDNLSGLERRLKTDQAALIDRDGIIAKLRGDYTTLQGLYETTTRTLSEIQLELGAKRAELDALTEQLCQARSKIDEKNAWVADYEDLEHQLVDARRATREFEDKYRVSLADLAGVKAALSCIKEHEKRWEIEHKGLLAENARLEQAAQRNDVGKLSSLELVVLFAQHRASIRYRDVADNFDAVFPEGITDDIASVCNSELEYVLSDDTKRQLVAVGISPQEKDLGIITAQLAELSQPFEESEFHYQNLTTYLGAVALSQNAQASATVRREILDDALVQIREYEDARDGWGKNQEAASRLAADFKVKRTQYADQVRGVLALGKPLSESLPLIVYVTDTPQEQSADIILPSTPVLRDRRLSRTIFPYVAFALKESLPAASPDSGIKYSMIDIQGARVLRLTFQKSSPDHPSPDVQKTLMQSMVHYQKSPLAQLGLQLKLELMGDVNYVT